MVGSNSSVHTESAIQKIEYDVGVPIRIKRAKPATNWFSTPKYYKSVVDGKKRFVELAFFIDNSMYTKYDSDENLIHKRLQSVTHEVNLIYKDLGITVVLVYTEIWKDGDPFEVSTDPDKTLASFLEYRKGQIKKHPHDNAHLLTNVKFDGIVGKAYKGTMCSYDYSGGVDVDHSSNAAAVAATVAHEMGHNFGMEHDLDYNTCRCPISSCIMAPSLNILYPQAWSDCSIGYLSKSLKRGVDYCLKNEPKQKDVKSVCGDGIVGPGEDCDCGGIDATLCANKCCDPKNCKLTSGAVCATGDCCDLNTCKPFAKATICRAPANSCDLPEFCDGENNQCPGDFYVQDGLPCPDDPQDYCYNGKCGSRTQQCHILWGESGASLHDECYQQNVRGTFYGNCAYDKDHGTYSPCDQRDAMCGRLHCQKTNERPVFGESSTVYAAYSKVIGVSGQEISCNVVRTTFTGDEPDPGLVPDGANCGEDKICVGTKCVNRTAAVERVQKCKPSDCNGLGVCNNVGNCHCKYGYGGEACAIPGYGGSVNSGPASDTETFNAFMTMFWLLLILSFLFIGATIILKRKKNIWLPGKVWEGIRNILNLQSLVRVPVRKAPPPPTNKRARLNDFNAAWDNCPGAANGSIPPLPNIPVIPRTQGPNRSDSSSNTSLSDHPMLSADNRRPEQPPPPPPHRTGCDNALGSRPPLPRKPPVVKRAGAAARNDDSVTTVSVKDLAAKFNSVANV